jgi:hypothetical protein
LPIRAASRKLSGVAGDPTVLSFYRADSWRVLGRGFIVSGTAMTIGALFVAASFRIRIPIEVHETLFAVGIVLIVFGGLMTVIGFTRALRDDTCVVARTDGVMLLAQGRETFVAWRDLERVRFDESARVVVFEKKGGGEHRLEDRRYGDETAEGLAKTLDEMRRKAEWNLLKR